MHQKSILTVAPSSTPLGPRVYSVPPEPYSWNKADLLLSEKEKYTRGDREGKAKEVREREGNGRDPPNVF